MREERDEIINKRRFGTNSENHVNNKIKEIFHTELTDLTEEYDIPTGTADNVKKIIENEEAAKTVEGIFIKLYYIHNYKHYFINGI